jgi:hypothetical protein
MGLAARFWRSWLMDIDKGMNDGSPVVRIFTKHERNP